MFADITQFANPEFLWLLLVIPLIVGWHIWKQRRATTAITHSKTKIFGEISRGWRVRLRYLPFALRMLALAALIIAFARPQSSARGENVFREGIDITLVLDVFADRMSFYQ